MSEPKSLYNDVIMDHIKNARNFQALAGANREAHGVNPLCGDTFTVYLRVENERVLGASFQCECCGISMASASIMTEAVKGRTLSEAKSLFRNFDRLLRGSAAATELPPDSGQLAVLSLVREFPSRINCAELAWLTLDAALEGRESAVLTGSTVA